MNEMPQVFRALLRHLALPVARLDRLDPDQYRSRLRGLGLRSGPAGGDGRGDALLGVVAFVEAKRAGQGVLDQVLSRLRPGDALFKVAKMLTQQFGMVHGVVRREQLTQLAERESRVLRHEDQRHLRQVLAPVTTLSEHVPLGIEQPGRFPMPQHMRGEAEAVGQLADRKIRT
jgi:hypothetical protein